MQHGLLEQRDIAVYRCLHTHLLYTYAGCTGGSTCQGQSAYNWHVDPVFIDIAWDLDDAAVGQIRDVVLINDIEVSPVHTSSLKRLDDVRTMLLAALLLLDHRRIGLEPVGKVCLKPVTPLGADAQVPTGLAVDPA